MLSHSQSFYHYNKIIKTFRNDIIMSHLLPSSAQPGYLTGKLLIAMPYMQDQRFHQSVIYVCGHDETGGMGLIVNKPLVSVNFKDLLAQVEMNYDSFTPNGPIHYGGPVEVGRGFVLHTVDYLADASVTINDNLALTATLQILRAIAERRGPRNALVALGYVGWNAGQLETELQNNSWLVINAHENLIFHPDSSAIWQQALNSIGINPAFITQSGGHA